MRRYMIFVDGSNLVGVLKRMSLRVDDYERFYRFILERSIKTCDSCIVAAAPVPAILVRVLWYAVGSLDEWDLTDAKAQASLRDAFNSDSDLKRMYMPLAGQKLPGKPQEEVLREAWALCFADIEAWFIERRRLVDGFRRFYYSIRSGTDFIDIVECGHWKVDMLYRSVSEKGLDTRLAVDMVTQVQNYDVAVLISGDADNIPSLDYIKAAGKQVGVIEFLGGYPPEKKSAHSSSRLKVASDFVAQIYEMELIKDGLAQKHAPGAPGAPSPATAQPATAALPQKK